LKLLEVADTQHLIISFAKAVQENKYARLILKIRRG
jgi:hypothetical protein